jgi:hypothetical protein
MATENSSPSKRTPTVVWTMPTRHQSSAKYTAATGYFAGKVFYLIVERRSLNRAPVQRAVVVATVS